MSTVNFYAADYDVGKIQDPPIHLLIPPWFYSVNYNNVIPSSAEALRWCIRGRVIGPDIVAIFSNYFFCRLGCLEGVNKPVMPPLPLVNPQLLLGSETEWEVSDTKKINPTWSHQNWLFKQLLSYLLWVVYKIVVCLHLNPHLITQMITSTSSNMQHEQFDIGKCNKKCHLKCKLPVTKQRRSTQLVWKPKYVKQIIIKN